MKKALLQLKHPIFFIGVLVLFAFSPTSAHAGIGSDIAKNVGLGILDSAAAIIGTISMILLKLASLANMLAGLLLNDVIKWTVVDMAKNYDGITAISSTWTVMRDIANMAFIFVLLYASIKKILGQGDDVNRLIVNMVIAALLINFSLFFTKIVIDASNLVALTFYNSIAPGAVNSLLDKGLSNSMMQPLHLQTFWSTSGTFLSDPKTMVVVGIMGTLFTLIATFVFVAVAFLFIIRYVVLIFVLIMSPVFFLASILPSMKDTKTQWVNALTGQALFAPLYMLMTWITLKVFSNLNFGDTANFAKALTGEIDPATNVIKYPDGSIDVFLNFIIVIAFLIISIVIAKSASDKSGKGMSKITGKAFGFAGGATFGLAGRFGRGTAGRLGAQIGDNEKLKEAAAKGGMRGRLAQLTLSSGQKTASASFDGRGIGALGSLQAGKPQKGGYTDDVKKRVKAEEDRVKSLEPSAVNILKAELEVKRTEKEFGNGSAEHQKAQETLLNLKGNKDDIKKKNESLDDERKKKVTEAQNEDASSLKDAEVKQRSYQDQVAKAQSELAGAKTDEDKAKAQSQIDAAKAELENAKKETAAIRKQTADKVKQINDSYESQKKANSSSEQAGAGDRRKEAMIEGLTHPSIISGDRVMYGGMIDRSALQAAANLRKPKKSVKDTVLEAIKEEEDKAKKPKGETGDENAGDAKTTSEAPKT